MDFDELCKDLDNEKSGAKGAKERKPFSENEKKLFELEAEINKELQNANPKRKGCFGKLVKLIDSPICKTCIDAQACEDELIKNGHQQVADVEDEVNAIVASEELEKELIEIGKLIKPVAGVDSILNAIYAAAKSIKEPSSDVKKPAIAVPSNIADVDISDLGKKCKVEFDFNKAKDMILAEKPADWKRVREICKSLIDVEFTATAYGNAKKIMTRLGELGVIGWDAVKSEITYSL